MYLVTAAEMQAMDRATIEEFGLPGRILMEIAGRGAFDLLGRRLGERVGDLTSKKIGVLCGRGNNGGDGFVIARYLDQVGVPVTVFLLADAQRVSGDAAANLSLLAPLNIPVVQLPTATDFARTKGLLATQEIWVDALLGTGLNAPVRGYFREVIDFINANGRPVLAVDIPSGLNADTGQPMGSCIQATATATFAFAKIGHQIEPGVSLSGHLEIVDIGIPPHITRKIAPKQQLLTPQMMQQTITPRPPQAHKGTTGHLLVVAGSPGKTGAAAMTATAALRSGAGLVTLATPRSLNPIMETQLTEAMTIPVPETAGGGWGPEASDALRTVWSDQRAVALGPGLGQDPKARELVHSVVRNCPKPLIIDADGLNCLEGSLDLLAQAPHPPILTPHPGEMARLAGLPTREIQADRVGTARRFAQTHRVYLVLKGARTVIAHPDGQVEINPTGNAGMAAGGMGDVLTGIIAGFITQGYDPSAACRLGVYLHGAAADELAAHMGSVGYLAGEIMAEIPRQLARLAATA